ncbi:hypothetical protein [aff. Roholtiella sp. LEGE 12411]|uniref:hypothetical protein n=1 Tax=aff. Roholtiella sp. LEGE 12411 TaxID=1828822 RepID=UPI00187F8426|nr:hypothetical protein [aff. Roholtiella sp. LEGE 12411]MBE9038715.1 hypothetical protein [aff. Roholtiella sp. LEGE 12411]
MLEHFIHLSKMYVLAIASGIVQYGSVKAKSVIDDVKIWSLNSLSSTSVLWFFGAKL